MGGVVTENRINDFETKEIHRFFHYVFDGNYSFRGHRHYSWELDVLLDGSLEIILGDRTYILKSGDAILIEPRVFHRNKVLCNKRCEFIVTSFTCEEFPIRNPYKTLRLTQTTDALLNILNGEFKKITKESGKDIFSSEIYVPPILKKTYEVFLYNILNNHASVSQSTEKYAQIYRNAVRFMNKNLNS